MIDAHMPKRHFPKCSHYCAKSRKSFVLKLLLLQWCLVYVLISVFFGHFAIISLSVRHSLRMRKMKEDANDKNRQKLNVFFKQCAWRRIINYNWWLTTEVHLSFNCSPKKAKIVAKTKMRNDLHEVKEKNMLNCARRHVSYRIDSDRLLVR